MSSLRIVKKNKSYSVYHDDSYIGFIYKKDFKDLAITLQEKTDTAEAVVLKYGAFIQTIVDFIIIAFAIFMSMKLINNLKRSMIKEEKAEEAAEAAAEPSADIKLLTEIRDLLKEQKK